jgi:hypothetical protein
VSDPLAGDQIRALDPVQESAQRPRAGLWTTRLVWFLRGMAVLSMLKGLFHWSVVVGVGDGPDNTFIVRSLPWQTATVFFAVIDLVAAVGLWLAAVWGAVVWLTASVSMAAVEVFFPQVYGGRMLVVLAEVILLGCYVGLAVMSAREHPH